MSVFTPITMDEFHQMTEHDIHNAFAFIGEKSISNLKEMLVPRPKHKWHEYGVVIERVQYIGFNFKHIVNCARRGA